jgi:hypothetical protein
MRLALSARRDPTSAFDLSSYAEDIRHVHDFGGPPLNHSQINQGG